MKIKPVVWILNADKLKVQWVPLTSRLRQICHSVMEVQGGQRGTEHNTVFQFVNGPWSLTQRFNSFLHIQPLCTGRCLFLPELSPAQLSSRNIRCTFFSLQSYLFKVISLIRKDVKKLPLITWTRRNSSVTPTRTNQKKKKKTLLFRVCSLFHFFGL